MSGDEKSTPLTWICSSAFHFPRTPLLLDALPETGMVWFELIYLRLILAMSWNEWVFKMAADDTTHPPPPRSGNSAAAWSAVVYSSGITPAYITTNVHI